MTFKTHRTQRNFDRQMWAITGLSVCRDGYELLEFKTEEWAGGSVFVKRIRKPGHVERCAYHEAFVIGPRGAVKELYSNFDAF